MLFGGKPQGWYLQGLSRSLLYPSWFSEKALPAVCLEGESLAQSPERWEGDGWGLDIACSLPPPCLALPRLAVPEIRGGKSFLGSSKNPLYWNCPLPQLPVAEGGVSPSLSASKGLAPPTVRLRPRSLSGSKKLEQSLASGAHVHEVVPAGWMVS